MILKAIHNNPGIKVSEILSNLTHDGNQVTWADWFFKMILVFLILRF